MMAVNFFNYAFALSKFNAPNSVLNTNNPPETCPDNGLSAFCATGICCGLNESEAAQLLAMAQPISFVSGSRMVRHGEPSRGAYVIRKGRIEARLTLPGGGEKTIMELSDGSMFGEMSLLDNGQSIASVFAVTNVDGWFIERNLFRALIAGRNPAALAIQRTVTSGLVARLAIMNSELQKQIAPEDRVVTEPAPVGDPLADSPRKLAVDFDFQRLLPILPFFAGFSEDEIDYVVASATVLEVARGQWLFAAEQPADACYLVVRGAVEANLHIDGRERRLAILGPGSLVGYMGIVADMPHNANTVARENSVVLEFTAAAFLALYKGISGAEVKTQHAIQCNLLQSLSRSYSQLSRLVTQAQLSEALQARL